MGRRMLSKKVNKKSFAKTAKYVNGKNVVGKLHRGGIRL